ncbi:hypothetical protein Rhopal_004250-T1 [Rhodotorula paludigena]|uniref:F-box domain-containing protein n=1 Tax=Rhodotorula paludigena TaxID=86838 RepID=A0AAV5GP08_9BASI|nr:hypothetical protein Rhopal_004250-T1 [Rhodotorula paludigena]
MASQDSETDVSSFQGPETAGATLRDLPHELLKFIVELVAEQDDDVLSGSVRVARAGHDSPRRLSSWYARGVGALSCLNKHMRRLSLPHLCRFQGDVDEFESSQTVTAKQLAQPIVQMRRIPPAILAGVRTLDLRYCPHESFAAAGAALSRLSNLCTLCISTMTSHARHGDDSSIADAAREYALDAFAARSSEISNIVIQSGLPSDVSVAFLRRFAAPDRLRRLELRATTSSFDNPALPPILRSCDRLVHLEVWDWTSTDLAGLDDSPWWVSAPTLFNLRTFRLSSRGLRAFRFIQRLAPNVRALSIAFSDTADMVEEDEMDEIEPVYLPKLRRLKLEGGKAAARSLPLFNLMTLVELDVSIFEVPCHVGELDCAELFPSDLLLPCGLVFTFIAHRLLKVSNELSLENTCKKQGVRLRRMITDLLSPFSPPSRSSIDESDHDISVERAEAVQDVIEWAAKRHSRACKDGDVGSLEELAVQLRSVEEMRVVREL